MPDGLALLSTRSTVDPLLTPADDSVALPMLSSEPPNVKPCDAEPTPVIVSKVVFRASTVAPPEVDRERRDQRGELVTELVRAIGVVKTYSCEAAWGDRIAAVREAVVQPPKPPPPPPPPAPPAAASPPPPQSAAASSSAAAQEEEDDGSWEDDDDAASHPAYALLAQAGSPSAEPGEARAEGGASSPTAAAFRTRNKVHRTPVVPPKRGGGEAMRVPLVDSNRSKALQ